MAEPVAPDQFSAAFEKSILRNCRPSVFFVMFSPREGETKRLKARMDEVNVLPEEKRTAELTKHRAGTGFVVADGENGLKILTCAHLIDHVFTANNPISVAEAKKLFVVRVLCDHAEIHYLEGIAAGRKRGRAYSVATVIDIDCAKDMLLIQIANDKISRSVSAAGKAIACTSPHPRIGRGLNPQEPEALDKRIMISWPSEKHLQSLKGRVSHWSRTIKVMPGKNENGYTMKLIEVDIRSEKGASGSALLNGQDQFIGMLHGGDVQFSYFVSLDDMSVFLDRNGVYQ